MAISLLTLPYELREQIIMPLLYQEGSIRLQRPVETPSIFTPPIVQVCKMLREEAIRVFYYVNTFTWTIDPEAVEAIDPATYPLSDLQVNEKHDVTGCPPVSMLPWQCPGVITTLRHLRLNLYLPDPYSARLWEDVLAQQLANLIRAFDNGWRLRDLRVLIVTWHQFRDISTRQAEILGIFEQVHMRGHVQVKTRSIDGKLRAALHNLDLTNRMRDSVISRVPIVNREDCKVAESDMDWEWEGGITI